MPFVNTIPKMAREAVIGIAQISTGNSALTDSGSITQVSSGDANGSIITAVVVKATETVTAGMVRLWIDNGTTRYLIAEIPVSATTPGANTKSFESTWTPSYTLELPDDTWKLAASTENAETFNVVAFGYNF